MSDPGTCAEREVVEPTLLCRRDGSLNPAAVGWSRHPLLTANLSGSWGRNKRWEYWCVTAETHLLALTFSDIDYLGLLNVWFLEFSELRELDKAVIVPLARGISLPDRLGGAPMHYDGHGLDLEIDEEDSGTRLRARVSGRSGVRLDADVLVERPAGHETLNVVIPWSERRFQFTSKQNTRPAVGSVRVDGETFRFGPENRSWGCLDHGRGRWRYRTEWNWGSASGESDGHVVGLQFGGRWTEGTGATENALCIDGRLSKLSEELVWEYSTADFTRPWHLTTPGSNRVTLVFTPFHERTSRADAVVIGTDVHQCFGHWSGVVVDDSGEVCRVEGLLGWAEQARMRW